MLDAWETPEVLHAAFELVKAAIENMDEEPETEAGKIGGNIRNYVLQLLIDATGRIPGNGELDEWCKDIVPDRDDFYVLVDSKTRLPVEHGHDFLRARITSVGQLNAEWLDAAGLEWLDLETYNEEQAVRDEAAEAERKAEAERNRYHINVEEHAALMAFAQEHGRMWKSKLRAAWEKSEAGPVLQYLRNHKCFGPEGLERFKLPKKAA